MQREARKARCRVNASSNVLAASRMVSGQGGKLRAMKSPFNTATLSYWEMINLCLGRPLIHNQLGQLDTEFVVAPKPWGF